MIESHVNVLLKPVGSAPMVSEARRDFSSSMKVSELILLLKSELLVDTLLIYVNAAFSPSLSDTLGELAKNFANQSCLNLQYSITPAWG